MTFKLIMKNLTYTTLLLAFLLVKTLQNGVADRMDEPMPVVIWHGMGDNCCNPLSMGYIARLIKNNVPGIYVRSLMLGNNVLEDIERGFFADMNEETESVCNALQQDQHLRNGYNLIGFSQGALFARALAQRCPKPEIKNLISIGGPQQGVFGLPLCPGSDKVCSTVRRLLDYGAYTRFVQKISVQAQYWHDPKINEGYKNKSIFLADLNCESRCNETYKTNLLKLKNFVLIKFLQDEMIVPKDSSWFGFFGDNNASKIIPMEETQLYKDDLIGLKELNLSGRMHFLAIDGMHLQISAKEFIREIVKKYLVSD